MLTSHKRVFALGAILILTLALAAGCTKAPAGSGSGQDTISGTVAFDGPGLTLSGTVTLPADKANATGAVIALCEANNLPYDYSAGFFSGIGGVASTATDGWLLYIDDVQSMVGSDDAALTDGFSVAFRYENYDEAFALK